MIASIGITVSDATLLRLSPLLSARLTPPLGSIDELPAASAVRPIPEKARTAASPQAVNLIVLNFIVISFVSECFTQVITKLLRLLTNISLISFFVNIDYILPHIARNAHFMRLSGIKKGIAAKKRDSFP